MIKLAIVYREHTEAAVQCAKKLVEQFKKTAEVYTASEQKVIAGTKMLPAKIEPDYVIVIGGDGTYLRAVRLFKNKSIPMLGFNMGSLGFLTPHSVDQVEKVVRLAISKKLITEKRMMLQAYCKSQKKFFDALNDLVIERGGNSQLINAELLVDKKLVAQVKADGFIVASPTGSTAYNLAAGGPLLEPSVPAFLITPVAPHSLTSRPLVVSSSSILEIRLVPGRNQKANFVVDGQKQSEMTGGDSLTVTQSKHLHIMLMAAELNSFQLLRDKLKFGDRA